MLYIFHATSLSTLEMMGYLEVSKWLIIILVRPKGATIPYYIYIIYLALYCVEDM